MPHSIFARLTPSKLLQISDCVKYDPIALNGLTWIGKRKGRRQNIGRTFWINQESFQSSQVVMAFHGKWPAQHQTAVTRIDKNGPWGNVENLKWVTRQELIEEAKENKRLASISKALGNNAPDLGERLRLSTLCRRGHSWNGHPLTLQVLQGTGWRCRECDALTSSSERAKTTRRKWYEANAEQIRAEARERARLARSTPEGRAKAIEAVLRRRAKAGRPSRARGLDGLQLPPGASLSIPEARIARKLITEGMPVVYETLKPVIDEQMAAEREVELLKRQRRGRPSAELDAFLQAGGTTEEWKKKKKRQEWHSKMQSLEFRLYHREKSKRRKALLRKRMTRQISVEQLRARYAQFDNCCAYCGAGGDMEMDHVVPIAGGGTHAIGNIVPACKACNRNKRDHEVESWYRRRPSFTETRWRKICRVLGWNRGAINQLALL